MIKHLLLLNIYFLRKLRICIDQTAIDIIQTVDDDFLKLRNKNIRVSSKFGKFKVNV